MFNLSWKGSRDEKRAVGSCEGYLFKLKRKQKVLTSQWTWRFFSVQGKFFKWYENENATEASGALDLSQVTEISEFKSGNEAICFIIRCADRNMMLRAKSVQERDKWLRILRQSTSFAKGGDGTSVDFTNTAGRAALSQKSGSSSLAGELDRALDQLNKMEESSGEQKENVNISVTGRFGANCRDGLQPSREVEIPKGGAIIRSSDSEICVGKEHAALSRHKDGEYQPRSGASQFSSDMEIVVGMSKNDPTPASVNSSAIMYEDDEYDGVMDFDELPDEEEFLYQEKLRLGRGYTNDYGRKTDQVSPPSKTREENSFGAAGEKSRWNRSNSESDYKSYRDEK